VTPHTSPAYFLAFGPRGHPDLPLRPGGRAREARLRRDPAPSGPGAADQPAPGQARRGLV